MVAQTEVERESTEGQQLKIQREIILERRQARKVGEKRKRRKDWGASGRAAWEDSEAGKRKEKR